MGLPLTRRRRPDHVAAWVLLTVSLLAVGITFFGRPRYSYVAGFGVATAALYLLLSKNGLSPTLLINDRRFIPATSTMFMLVLALSALTLRSGANPYQRSLPHFVAASILFAVIGLQVVAHKVGPGRGLVIIEIAMATWWVRTAPQLLLPGALGIDSWFHLGVVQSILQNGTIPPDNVYRGLALFHVLSASIIEVSGLPGATSIIGLGPFLGALTGLGIYLAGRLIVDDQNALLAATAYGFFGYAVNMNFTVVAASLGAAYLVLSLAALVRYWRKPRVVHVLPPIIMMVALIGTHTIMALALFLVLATAFVVSRLASAALSPEGAHRSVVRGTLTLFLGVTMFAWWAYFSGYLVDLAQVIRWGFQFEPWTPTDTSLSYASSVPILEYILNLSGVIAVAALSVLGSFWFLRRGQHSPGSLSTLGGIWLLGLLGVLSIALQVTGLLGLRWILEFEVLAGLLVGPGLLWVSTRPRRRLSSLVAVCAVLAAVAFANLTGPAGNVDSSVYSPNTLVRLAFTPDELASLSHIAGLHPSSVSILYPDYYYFSYFKQTNAFDVGPNLANHTLSPMGGGLIVLRVSSLHGPIYYTQTVTKLNYDPISALSACDSRVYDSGSVVAFSSAW